MADFGGIIGTAQGPLCRRIPSCFVGWQARRQPVLMGIIRDAGRHPFRAFEALRQASGRHEAATISWYAASSRYRSDLAPYAKISGSFTAFSQCKRWIVISRCPRARIAVWNWRCQHWGDCITASECVLGQICPPCHCNYEDFRAGNGAGSLSTNL